MFRSPLGVLLLLLSACAGASGPAADRSGDDTDPALDDTDRTGPPVRPDGLRFQARYGEEAVGCGDTLAHVGRSQIAVRLMDLRFYVSDVVFSGPGGEADFVPKQDDPWTHLTAGLIDLEDGTADCEGRGTPDTNDRLVGEVPDGDWTHVTFTLGLPFDLNHAFAVDGPFPLAAPGLGMTRQAGHRFLRADVVQGVAVSLPSWNVQITSGGCSSSSADTPPEFGCDRPNLARIRLPYQPFHPRVRPTIVLDVGALLASAELKEDKAGPPGCNSHPDDTFECSPVFTALGMNFHSGTCVDDCSGQTAFRTVCHDRSSGEAAPCPTP